jgi:hypothetical protein
MPEANRLLNESHTVTISNSQPVTGLMFSGISRQHDATEKPQGTPRS